MIRGMRDWYKPVEVCLDSGADCHVLPLSFYSEELGTTELSELRMMITDAQENAIRTAETRANITFKLQKENGRTLKVIDSCVFGEVTQPLFAVGKLWKTARFDWSTRTTYDPTEDSMEFPYRTVFYGPCSGDKILWSEMEMFSCAKEWQGFEMMEFEKVEDVVITILERTP